jgi:hypothetical protein
MRCVILCAVSPSVLRVAVVVGWDSAAASKDDEDEETQQEGLDTQDATRTGAGEAARSGAGRLLHGAGA